jgi:uncharacterized protein
MRAPRYNCFNSNAREPHNLIHPDTELRFVGPEIGFGVFATKAIPKGTVTWVGDPLDQIVSSERFSRLPEHLRSIACKYSYLNGAGERILCWDHARFVNHSCAATCLSPGFDFEIAVRDIAPGDELTDDYGTLNIEEPFACLCGTPGCRGTIRPDDPLRLAPEWDALTSDAFAFIRTVQQPMWELVREKDAIARVLCGEMKLPSMMRHYCGASVIPGNR